MTITRSRAIDKLRSRRRKDEGAGSPQESSRLEGVGTVGSGAAESEARLSIRGALAQLPEAQRVVLELAYFDGFTQSEIAARLEEPLGTVKTRLRAGLERLRGFLGAKSGGLL